MKLRIAGISHESVTDGPGMRSVVFFQGCPHACPGCHNPQTWNYTGGEETDSDQLVRDLRITPLISGVTFSGGEPFAQAKAALKVAEFVKGRALNLWVYTGYTWERLLEATDRPAWRELMALADVIVDGPFMKELRDLSLPYRGSSNQRIIRAQQSLEENRVVRWISMSG